MPQAMTLVDEPDRLRAALSPLRRTLLARLHEPASATELAASLGLPRQRVNYHVRALERDGLVELVAERQRRGCTERMVQATANAFLVDPEVLSGASTPPRSRVAARDRFAPDHLMSAAATTVRDVGRMAGAAQQQGQRLLTFTVEAELSFAAPADVHRFTGALADALATLAEAHSTPGAGRRYRVVVGGHPATAETSPDPSPTDGRNPPEE